MSLSDSHHIDLVSAAREVLSKMGPRSAGSLSINDAACTVTERETGELMAYVAREWTDLSYQDLIGWSTWPRKLPTR